MVRGAFVLLMLLVLPAPLRPLTAGAPPPPRPGPLPRHWGSWSNDAFGGEIQSNPDDLRSNAVTAGLRFRHSWISEIDFSTLTNKQAVNGTDPGRIDELTVAVGYLVAQERREDGHFMLASGVGLRYADDLGMGAVQNEWHDLIDFAEIDLPYETARGAGFAWASWQWVGLTDITIPDNDSIFSDGSRFGLVLDGQSVFTHRGGMFGELGVALLWAGHDSAVWLGARRVLRAGETMSETAQVVADSEKGSWLEYGISVGAIIFKGGLDLDSDVSTGTIGWMYKRRSMHAEPGGDVFTGEFGATLNSYGLSGQVRWAPYWLQQIRWLGARSNLFLDYRFGRVPDFTIIDTSLRYQQFSVGWDLTAFAPRDGFQVNPYAYGGIGYRIEDVQPEGPQGPIPRQAEESPALLYGIGLRSTWGKRPSDGHGIQYGFSLSFDRWDAFGDRVIESPYTDDEFTILDENHSITLRILASIGW